MGSVHSWVQHQRQSQSQACANHLLIITSKSSRDISQTKGVMYRLFLATALPHLPLLAHQRGFSELCCHLLFSHSYDIALFLSYVFPLCCWCCGLLTVLGVAGMTCNGHVSCAPREAQMKSLWLSGTAAVELFGQRRRDAPKTQGKVLIFNYFFKIRLQGVTIAIDPWNARGKKLLT